MKMNTLKGLRMGAVAAALAVAAATALGQERAKPVAAPETGTASAPATGLPATRPLLGMGSRAPMPAGKFIKGEPVTAYEPGVVYVFEFWATWCLPCKAAIPHLNELHAKYKDKGVVIIGQSVWETGPEAAPKFVEQMGDKMAYRIALDTTEGEPAGSKGVMARTWLGAAGVGGIPSTWVVKDGRVLWIGHPRDLSAELLDSVRGNTFDAGVAKKDLDEKAALQERTRLANQNFWDAVNDKDVAAVDRALAELKEVYGSRPGAPESLRSMRLRSLVALGKYAEALEMAHAMYAKAETPRDRFNQRMKAAHELLVVDPTDAGMLKEIGSIIDSMEAPEGSDLAKVAYLKSKYKAWVAILAGDKETAVKLQEEVIARMPENMFKPVEVRSLDLYRQGKPPGLMPKHSRDRKAPATTKPASAN